MLITQLQYFTLQLPPQLSKENIKAQERCDFDLCSSCAEKKNVGNACSKGHQIHPIKLGGHFRNWSCDFCDYKCSPGGKIDGDVVVWRCEKDIRS